MTSSSSTSSSSNIDGGIEHCCICLESLDTPGISCQRLPCSHVMHEHCVTEMRRRGGSGACPVCQESHTDLTPLQVLMDRAEVHYKRQEYTKATELWQEVLNVEASNANAVCNMGICYHRGEGVPQDCSRAMELYEEAYSSGQTRCTSNLGILYADQGDFEKAVELWEQGRRVGQADAITNLAVHHHKCGQPQKAIELYEQARYHGQVPSANLSDLAVLYEDQGQLQKAIQLYEEARCGGSLSAAANLGKIYEDQEQLHEAFTLYSEAWEGGLEGVGIRLGRICEKQGQLSLARAFYDYDEAHQQGTNLPWELSRRIKAESACKLGLFYLEQNEIQRAADLFLEAHEGEIADATFNLGMLHARPDLNNYNPAYAIRLLEVAASRGCTDLLTCYSMTNTLYKRQGQYAKVMDVDELARRIMAATATNPGIAAAVDDAMSLSIGDSVTINGLFAETTLNRKQGTIVELDFGRATCTVRIPGLGVQKGLKFENVSKVPKSTLACDGLTSGNCTSKFKPGDELQIGDIVRIQGLTSNSGLPLNGRSGKVVSFDASTGRFGIEVHSGFGKKAIRAENLTQATVGEIPAHAATEESELEAVHDFVVSETNAEVSEALVRNRQADIGSRVVLLKFSRPSEAMRQILLEADELRACRQALAAQGSAVELDSGAKILVRPEHHGPVLASIELYGLKLYNDHVIVDPDLEDVVLKLAQKLPGRLSVYPKHKRVVPLELAESPLVLDGSLSLTRTFIEIRVPNSLRSDSDRQAPRTASTTDADPRKYGCGCAARRRGPTGNR